MMKKPFLNLKPDHTWRNWHDTSGVGGRARRFYTPHNLWADGTGSSKEFLPGLAGLQTIVQAAEADNLRVRAVGSGWSLSGCAFTDECLVNTSRLTAYFVGFKTPTMVEPAYQEDERRKRLVFAQCGVQIKTLNTLLAEKSLALPTSGASNGQTIAGAVSTGTHGAANQVGAMQDFILGIHVVAEGGKHYWVEREAHPVVTQEFCDWIGAEPRRDDKLFRAMLVGFGSFGLVHAFLFEAEPIYVLDRHVRQSDFSVVRNAIGTLNMAGLDLPDGNTLPFHFEVVLNPYRLGTGEMGAFQRFMYKRPAPTPLPAPTVSDRNILINGDLLGIAGDFLDAVPDAIPKAVQLALSSSFKAPKGKAFIQGTPGQIFHDSTHKGSGTSLEIGVPLNRIGDTLDTIVGVVRNAPLGAPIALRFVKGSDAFLAFTHFSPYTCTLEMPGIDSSLNRTAYEKIWKALLDSDIPHTYHWGQALPLSPEWVTRGYGGRLNEWIAARESFLSLKGRRMFANTLSVRCGLSEP